MTRSRALLWGVLALAALVRFIPALRRPLQVDEGYTLHVAGMPLSEGMQVLRQLDVHPPLFLWMTHALVVAGAPDLALRATMAAFGVASVALLYWIVRLWHGEDAAVIAAFCAAVMPSLIYYDPMIRMYAPFDAVALGSFLVLSVLYTRDNLSLRARRTLWVAWAACGILLLYLLYLGFLVIAAQLLFAALIRRDGLVRSLAGAAATVGLWLPQLGTFLYQLPRGGLAFPQYEHHQLPALFELVGQATIAVQTHGAGSLVAIASVAAWLWLIGALALAWPNNRRSLLLWLGAPAALTLAYGIAGQKLLYTDRYYLLLAYALCACTGVAAVRLWERTGANLARRAPLWLAAAALAGISFAYALGPALYTADWPAVAGLLRERSQAKDLIVFNQGSPFFVLKRGDSLNNHPLLVLLRRSEVRSATRLVRPFGRIWLVIFQSGPLDPDNAVLHYLETNYHTDGVWYFRRALPAENAVVVLFNR